MLLKKLSVLICVLLLGAMLVSCIPTVAVDEYGYVESIGVDLGKEKKYFVYFLLQKEAVAVSESGSESSVTIVGAEGNSLFEALETCQTQMPYLLNISRANFIVLTEALSKSKELEPFLSIAFNILKIRKSINLMVVKEDIKGYFKGIDSSSTPNITKVQFSLLTLSKREGVIPIVDIGAFFEGINSFRHDSVMPYGIYDETIEPGVANEKKEEGKEGEEEKKKNEKRYGGMQSYTDGSAVFDGYKMVGRLDTLETQMMLIIRDEFERGVVTVKDKNGRDVSIQLCRLRKPEIKASIDDGVKVSFKCDIMGYIVFDPVDMSVERIEELKQQLKEFLEENLNKVFLKCQKLNSDAGAIGKSVVMNFTNTGEWERFSWKNKYPEAEVTFEVTAMLKTAIVGEAQ